MAKPTKSPVKLNEENINLTDEQLVKELLKYGYQVKCVVGPTTRGILIKMLERYRLGETKPKKINKVNVKKPERKSPKEAKLAARVSKSAGSIDTVNVAKVANCNKQVHVLKSDPVVHHHYVYWDNEQNNQVTAEREFVVQNRTRESEESWSENREDPEFSNETSEQDEMTNEVGGSILFKMILFSILMIFLYIYLSSPTKIVPLLN